VTIGLILVDIDGTLVGTGNKVPDSAWEAIARARGAGCHVAICTGRPCSGNAIVYARRVSPNEPHVFHSGAVVCTPDGVMAHAVMMPPASFRRQVALAREHNEALEVYTAMDCFLEQESAHTKDHAELINLKQTVIPDLLALLDTNDPIVRVQWVVPWAEWPTFETATQSDAQLEISVASQPDLHHLCFSSVTARGISKASAAGFLADHYELTLDQVAMVGDGDNDLEVFGVVGLPIAMGNSTPKALVAGKHIVAHVDNGGLAEAIDLALVHV
jgi:Cof subfamily protein (haloacid dehalogenase superfamily)